MATAELKSLTGERRITHRMDLRLPVEFRHEREGQLQIVRTLTRNVSTGGALFEMDTDEFHSGDRLDVELTIPPADGVSAYEGRARCPAEVLRVYPLNGDHNSGQKHPQANRFASPNRFGVAVRFLDRLRLSY